MKIKKFFKNISPFNDLYTEKDAIRGHSVDRYGYACQLINQNTNDSLIKAYAWLNLASQEIDRREPAKQLMHQVGFELKKRGLFEEALVYCKTCYDLYSAEAIYKKIYNSKNPINYFLRMILGFFTFMVNQVEFFDTQIIKKRGNAFFWGFCGASASCIGFFSIIFWMKSPGYISSTCLVVAMLSCVFSSAIYENRLEGGNGL